MEDDYAHPYEDPSSMKRHCNHLACEDSIEKFTTYEDYLDSQITPQAFWNLST